MLFTFKDFEQHFSESVLRKGMKLFENNRIELIKHPQNNTFYYLIDGNELVLNRTGEKILSCSCNCGSKIYCEHLSALLFYFHSDKIFDENGLKNQKTQKGTRRFSSNDTSKNNKNLQTWQEQLSKVRDLFNALESLPKLEEKQIEFTIRNLSKLLASRKNSANRFCTSLAIISEFSSVLNCRITGDETKLISLVDDCKENLDKIFSESLTISQNEVWLQALFNSLKNNRRLISEAYSFLLPRYLATVNDRDEVRKIYQLIVHRKLKLGNPNPIDKLKIAVLQVEIKLAGFFKTNIALALDKRGAEYPIAKAELELFSGNTLKAIRLLDKDHDRIRKDHDYQYSEYISYVQSLAKRKKLREIELKYLLKEIVNGFFISEEQFKQLDSLVNEGSRKKLIDALIVSVRANRRSYSFEKMSTILLFDNRTEELIKEIKYTKNNFHLLHSLLLKKLPGFNALDLSSYAQHVGTALLEGRYFKVQQNIIDKAMLYIEKLPDEEKRDLITRILNLSGHQAQISKYIQSAMPYLEENIMKPKIKKRFSPLVGKLPH